MKNILILSNSNVYKGGVYMFFESNFSSYNIDMEEHFLEVNNSLISNADLILVDTEKGVTDYIQEIKKLYNDKSIVLFDLSNKATQWLVNIESYVDGYISGTESEQELTKMIQNIIKVKETMKSKYILSKRNNPRYNINDSISPLTKKETQVFELISKGLNNIDIAQQMNIKESTVRKHLTKIFDKLDITNRRELILSEYNVA